MDFSIGAEIHSRLAVFVLVLARMSGLFMTAPFFSGSSTPQRLKVIVACGLAVCVTPLNLHHSVEAGEALGHPLSALLALAGELALGMAVGLLVALFIAAIQTAGYIIALDMGMAMANVLDPVTDQQTSAVGQIKSSFAVLLMLLLNLHHELIRALAGSFDLLPPGFVASDSRREGARLVMGDFAMTEGGQLFSQAIQMAAPVSVILFLVTIAMAFLARTVPEMNIFVLGYAIRLLIGLWLLALIFPVFASFYEGGFQATLERGADYFRQFSEAR